MSLEDIRDLLEIAMKAGAPQVAPNPLISEAVIEHLITPTDNGNHYFQEYRSVAEGRYRIIFMAFELPSGLSNYARFRFGFEDIEGHVLWIDQDYGTCGMCVLSDVPSLLWLRKLWFRVESLPSIRQGDLTTYPWYNATVKMYYMIERVV